MTSIAFTGLMACEVDLSVAEASLTVLATPHNSESSSSAATGLLNHLVCDQNGAEVGGCFDSLFKRWPA